MNLSYTLDSKTILKELKSSPKGLIKGDVSRRQKTYGLNEIKSVSKNPWWKILLEQFTNLMVFILLLALGVSLIAQEYVDAIAIGIILLINTIIGFFQEYKAEKAVEALKKMTAPLAVVIRNGESLQVDARELVPGDIIVLQEGSQVPADARLLECNQLQTIESSLTGESHPVDKSTDLVKKFESLGDLNNMVFMGTVINRGHGLAVVTGTGMKTEFGSIAHMVDHEDSGPTPLQKQLHKLSRFMGFVAIGIILLLLITSLYKGVDPIEIFFLSISIAVSVIPEGLPAVITLTLAIGVQKMARQKAIVRKLAAAETLGSTSVICSDKTGTLTQNQMTVQHLYLEGKNLQVTGIGYSPIGEIMDGNDSAKNSVALELLLKASALCNNARLVKEKPGTWSVLGDPTEGCLLTLAEKGGIQVLELQKKFPRTNELIFDSERKRMSTVNDSKLFTKGAPDAILEVCTHIQMGKEVKPLTEALKKSIAEQNEIYAKQAFRVLGFAYKDLSRAEEKSPKEESMIFLGLAGVIDPPREEVKAALEKCKSAQIKVVMITGDHAITAEAVGRNIGLYEEGDLIITGKELETMSDEELQSVVEKVRIFARVNPAHKVKILKALQSKGHVVAMTGDGVNDAPALKSADIGIAMGITGTDVAKAASKIILMDDNFSTIVKSIESGRSIFQNIKKFIRFLLSANIGELLIIVILYFMEYPIPLIPLQILWINLLTDSFPAIALGMDPDDKELMLEKPRDPKESIWKELIQSSLVSGVLATGICFFLYMKNIDELELNYTRTIVFTTMVVFELFLVFSIRFTKGHYFKNFFSNIYLLLGVFLGFAFQLLAVYVPFFQRFLETHPLNLIDWLWIVIPCIGSMVILELFKFFSNKKADASAS